MKRLMMLVVLGAVLFAGFAGAVSAAIISVSSGGSIQAAINSANSGDTINVAAGTYNEQLTINKALTINGSDGAVLDGTGVVGHFAVKDGTPTPANGWTTGVQIRSGNVTFNNIDVANFTQDGITAYDNIDMPNLHITNIKISNIQPGFWGFGIYVGYEAEGFRYSPKDLTTHLDFSGLLIEGNEITNVHSSALVLQSITGTPGTLIVRNNNIHDNITNDGIWIDTARNIVIENNIINKNKWGIEITSYGDWFQGIDGEGNWNYDFETRFEETTYGPKYISIRCNEINNNTVDGFALWDGWPTTIFVNYNNIKGNTPGMTNYLIGTLSAENNWWGSPANPSAQIVGPVDFTPWALNPFDGCTPTAITLASFDAKAGSNKVTLKWVTGDETDNLGFNVYRAEAKDGAYKKINQSLIASKVGSGLGTSYEFTDSGVKNRTTYFYKLEDVDVNGVKTMHGPVSAMPRLLYAIIK